VAGIRREKIDRPSDSGGLFLKRRDRKMITQDELDVFINELIEARVSKLWHM